MDELQLACLQHGTRRYGESFLSHIDFRLFLILINAQNVWGCRKTSCLQLNVKREYPHITLQPAKAGTI